MKSEAVRKRKDRGEKKGSKSGKWRIPFEDPSVNGMKKNENKTNMECKEVPPFWMSLFWFEKDNFISEVKLKSWDSCTTFINPIWSKESFKIRTVADFLTPGCWGSGDNTLVEQMCLLL